MPNRFWFAMLDELVAREQRGGGIVANVYNNRREVEGRVERSGQVYDTQGVLVGTVTGGGSIVRNAAGSEVGRVNGYGYISYGRGQLARAWPSGHVLVGERQVGTVDPIIDTYLMAAGALLLLLLR